MPIRLRKWREMSDRCKFDTDELKVDKAMMRGNLKIEEQTEGGWREIE